MAALFVWERGATAAIVLDDPQLWTNAPSVEGWQTTTDDATIDNPGTGGADGAGDGFLRITFDEIGFPMNQEDTLYSAGDGQTGSYQIAKLALGFDFYAADTLPGSAIVYMHSAVSDSTWEYMFDVAVNGWTRQAVPIDWDSGGSNWVGWGGETEFASDLESIDWIGVSVARRLSDPSEQIYGLDNWEYFQIPEPGTVVMLTVTLLSLTATLRKQIRRKPEDSAAA